jgi:hypothetical protein
VVLLLRPSSQALGLEVVVTGVALLLLHAAEWHLRRAALLTGGRAVLATVWVVEEVRRSGGKGRPSRIVGYRAHYGFRAEERGQAAWVASPHRRPSRGDRWWVYVDSRGRSIPDPRHW